MIPDFPIPDSGIPNSEFRMAYGESGIPHHEVLGPRGAHEGHMSRATGGVGHGMSNGNKGWDIRCRGGDPGRLVLNRNRDYGQRKGRGNRSKGTDTLGGGQSLGQLGSKAAGGRPHPRGNKKPRRVEPTGCGGGDWDLLAVAC